MSRPPTFEEALRDAMPIHDTTAVLEAHAREVRAAAIEALQKVIAEDVHPTPCFHPDRPKMHGPCHPSDGDRMCAAHRVLVFEYPPEQEPT